MQRRSSHTLDHRTWSVACAGGRPGDWLEGYGGVQIRDVLPAGAGVRQQRVLAASGLPCNCRAPDGSKRPMIALKQKRRVRHELNFHKDVDNLVLRSRHLNYSSAIGRNTGVPSVPGE